MVIRALLMPQPLGHKNRNFHTKESVRCHGRRTMLYMSVGIVTHCTTNLYGPSGAARKPKDSYSPALRHRGCQATHIPHPNTAAAPKCGDARTVTTCTGCQR